MLVFTENSFNKDWVKKVKFNNVLKLHPTHNEEDLKKHFIAAGGIIVPLKLDPNGNTDAVIDKGSEDTNKGTGAGGNGGVKPNNKRTTNKPTA